MCSNYRPVTRQDRLLTFFGVERDRDEEPTDVFPLSLAPFIRLAQEGSGNKRIAVDGLFGLIPHFKQRELAYGRKTYNARSETVRPAAQASATRVEARPAVHRAGRGNLRAPLRGRDGTA